MPTRDIGAVVSLWRCGSAIRKGASSSGGFVKHRRGAEGKSFAENAWVGRTVCIGDQVRLNVSGPCPRCVMTTLSQGDLPKDPGILRSAVRNNGGNVGVYASITRGGTIRRGDRLRLE